MKDDRLLYATRYGGFTPDGRSYVVTNPEPPRDWFNILTNPMYGAFVRVSGRGRSFYNLPDINLVNSENRAFFVRDRDTGEFWSPSGWPARRTLTDFRCVHSPTDTAISSEYLGIHVELRAIVPLAGDVEMWRITVANRSKRTRRISFFSSYPLVLSNGRWPLWYYNVCLFDPRLKAMVAKTACNRSPRGQKYMAILASDPGPVAHDGSELAFVGATRTLAEPVTVENGRLTNSIGRGEATVAAVQHDFRLKPGERKAIHLALGVGNDRRELARTAKRYCHADRYAREWKKLKVFWKKHLGKPIVQTPDAEIDLMTNVWIRRQLVMQVLTERAGSGGRNARNTIQDAFGYLPFDAAPARQRIVDACSYQYTTGLIPMDWPRMPELDLEGRSTYLDGAIWILVLLAAYVRETGDWKFLDRVFVYRDGKTRDSVLDHMIAALRLLVKERGAHGLTLFKGGDWNDPLEAGPKGRGESTWTSMAIVWAINEFLPVLTQCGRAREAAELSAAAAELKRAVNGHCWDGAWYLRGFTDLGRKFGCAKDKEGRIYLNAQTWSVLSGIAPAERAATAMKSANRLCNTRYGAMLLAPPYTEFQPDLGRLTQKLAGVAENASVYNHAVMFKAYAECLMGDGDVAYDTVRRILPTARQNPPEKTLHIPMWMTNCYELACHGVPGRATDLYYTGTVPWFMLVVLEKMLGIRAGFDGLEINPCLPRRWKQCRGVRHYRGGEYHIRIRNPHGLKAARVSIVCDGTALPGNVLPIGKGKHHVEVTLQRHAQAR